MTDCAACQPPPDPTRPDNRAGRPVIDYRLGTFGEFRAAMLAAVATDPVLSRLTTRSSDDHAITLLDCASAVADVLCFYQDRYANEAFLATATQRRSILRLAELVGYHPRPGLSATTWLAFDVDAADPVALAPGQRVQSVPGPGEDPVIFETLEPLTADRRLNLLRAHLSPAPQASDVLAVAGSVAILDRATAPALSQSLRPNDHVVLWGNATGKVEERTVAAVDTVGDRIAVTWTTPGAGSAGSAPQTRKWTRKLRLFGAGAPPYYVEPVTPTPTNASDIRWQKSPTTYNVSAGNTLVLEGRVDDLPVGTDLLVVPSGAGAAAPTMVTVTAVAAVEATAGPITDTATQATVTPNHGGYNVRRVSVYVLDGPPFTFWGDRYPTQPLGQDVYVPGFRVPQSDGTDAIEIGRRIERGEWIPGDVLRTDELEWGRPLLVTAAPRQGGDATSVEPVLARLRQANLVPAGSGSTDGQFCHLRLELDVTGALPGAHGEVVVLGNVTRASHGETVREVLGNGDANAAFQRFPLAKQPLTYLAAPVPGGARPTLAVAVDGGRWDEVGSLYGQPGNAPVITVRTEADGRTVVLFGDNQQGARPPTGVGNVTAMYRTGSGLAGRVGPDSLRTLLGAPVGVRQVTNPLPAEGGADPESAGSARTGAPRAVRTLGRAVSLADLGDLATESGQLAKASATWVWDGFDRNVHLTVAAQGGSTLSATALADIATSLDLARDPNHRLRVANFAAVPVVIEATIVVDGRVAEPDTVVTAARDALMAWLSFDVCELARPVNLSDAVAVLASVAGVAGVDVDRLGFKPVAARTAADLDRRGVARAADGAVLAVQARLRLFAARPDPAVPGEVLPAELAVVESPTQDVVVTRGSEQ